MGYSQHQARAPTIGMHLVILVFLVYRRGGTGRALQTAPAVDPPAFVLVRQLGNRWGANEGTRVSLTIPWSAQRLLMVATGIMAPYAPIATRN